MLLSCAQIDALNGGRPQSDRCGCHLSGKWPSAYCDHAGDGEGGAAFDPRKYAANGILFDEDQPHTLYQNHRDLSVVKSDRG